jgi:hypothetical protein
MSQTTNELDRIIDRFCLDLKKRINTHIQRQERKLVKEISMSNKISTRPTKKDPPKPQKTKHASSRSSSSSRSD